MIGIWLLKRSFIDDSANAGNWLAESAYEWSIRDRQDHPTVEEGIFLAPKYWRQQKQNGATVFPKNTVAVIFDSNSDKVKGFERYNECRR